MSDNPDNLSYDEFKRVCDAAGVADDEATMKSDYAMGQAVGEAIDHICVIAEEAPGPTPLEAAIGAVDAFIEAPSRGAALLAAAYLMKWAGEANAEEIKPEN